MAKKKATKKAATKKQTAKKTPPKRSAFMSPAIQREDALTTYHGVHPATIPEAAWDAMLEALRESGVVTEAARKTGFRRATIYERARNDEEFKDRFELAQHDGLKRLEDVAIQRATVGEAEDIYFQGDVVGQRFIRSDQLLMFLLQGRDPRYKRKQEITGANGGPLEIYAKYDDKELDALIKAKTEELGKHDGEQA